ncbi:hypothetical protein ACEWY4_008943 [Coilia grayii]|uniref:Uncharacterized protein n=1 Tax=Coilia grayii TaxID=363190 RepID=A0ABD1K522_9TELE
MDSGGARYGTLTDWLRSDVFIVFMVVLVLLILVLAAVCWVLRRQRRYRQPHLQYSRCWCLLCVARALTEIEVYPSVEAGEDQHRVSLKIRTDRSHAAELVGILAGLIRPIESPVELAASGEMSAVEPVSQAYPKLIDTPSQLPQTKTSVENINGGVLTPNLTGAKVFMPNHYNSSDEGSDDQSDGDCDDDHGDDDNESWSDSLK